MLVAREPALGWRQLLESVVCSFDSSNTQKPLDADLVFAYSRFEETASRVGPAPDQLGDAVDVLVYWQAALENVEDVARIALQKAFEIFEERRYCLLRMALGVREEHVVKVDEGGKEVAFFAGLALPVLPLDG